MRVKTCEWHVPWCRAAGNEPCHMAAERSAYGKKSSTGLKSGFRYSLKAHFHTCDSSSQQNNIWCVATESWALGWHIQMWPSYLGPAEPTTPGGDNKLDLQYCWSMKTRLKRPPDGMTLISSNLQVINGAETLGHILQSGSWQHASSPHPLHQEGLMQAWNLKPLYQRMSSEPVWSAKHFWKGPPTRRYMPQTTLQASVLVAMFWPMTGGRVKDPFTGSHMRLNHHNFSCQVKGQKFLPFDITKWKCCIFST